MTRSSSLSAPLALLLSLLALPGVRAHAADAPAPTAQQAQATPAKAAPADTALPGLPHYVEPPAYSVKLVFDSEQAKGMVMRRYVDAGRIRTEITGGPEDMVMIELGDEKGTTLMLMPKEKRAVKQSKELLNEMPGGVAKKAEAHATHETPKAPDLKVEDLGEEARDGRLVRKLRVTTPDGPALGWFDKATGAPVRIESTVDGKPAAVEWQDYKVGPQPAKLFEAPKEYQMMDLDAEMAKMKSMAGASGMGSALNGMMGGMGQSFGQSMGASLGTSLGGAFGGPLGAIAGQYLGGRIGGAVGRKAAETITPGK